MVVGIVGLGLIGGSLAKAYKEKGHTVFGTDTDSSVLDFAVLSEAIDEKLTDSLIGRCDLILIAVYPQAAIDFLEKNADTFSKDCIVIDCCGTKRQVCEAGFALAKKHKFTFIGGHPMAGSHKSGFKNSRPNLFSNAPMVIVPPDFDNILLLEEVKYRLKPAGFGTISVTTAEKHDELIAFTSQMAHVVSNAFIKSPTAKKHKGFSAGSYKDLTRVANLNPQMWCELFLENRDNLLKELNFFIDELQKYKSAVENNDEALLTTLLEEGKNCKQEVDRR